MKEQLVFRLEDCLFFLTCLDKIPPFALPRDMTLGTLGHQIFSLK